jgi:urease accessory protein
MTDRATAVVRAGDGRSDVIRARGAGALRLLTPRAAGNAAWIVTSSLGGGLVDGDDVALDVTVEAGATCVVTTQASTKAYRGTTRQQLVVRAGTGAGVMVVPDPIVPFAEAAVVSTTRVELAAGASLVLVDVLTAGRVASGERWAAARIDSTLTIVCDGTTRLHDRVVLAPGDGGVDTRMRGFTALATCVVIGPRVAEVAAAIATAIADEPLARDAALVTAVSPLADGMIVRIATREIEAATRHARTLLMPACRALGEDPWARKW